MNVSFGTFGFSKCGSNRHENVKYDTDNEVNGARTCLRNSSTMRWGGRAYMIMKLLYDFPHNKNKVLHYTVQ